jgi:hypothetical protein
MKDPLRKLLGLYVWILLIGTAWAEKGVLVVQVSDIHSRPVPAVGIAVQGSSESATTDRFGRTRIKLNPQTNVNDWIVLQIVQSPPSKDLVFTSPWDAHAQVPPFDNESVNFLPVVMANRGERKLSAIHVSLERTRPNRC